MRFRLRTLLIVLAIEPPLLAWAQDNSDPGKVLYGEWEIVEMTFHGKVQDFRGQPGGWFLFEPGGFIRSFNAGQRHEAKNGNKRSRKLITLPCTIGAREIDIVNAKPFGSGETTKASYDLRDGKLRVIWREDHGDRPTDFDALNDPLKTLFVLKKAN